MTREAGLAVVLVLDLIFVAGLAIVGGLLILSGFVAVGAVHRVAEGTRRTGLTRLREVVTELRTRQVTS